MSPVPGLVVRQASDVDEDAGGEVERLTAELAAERAVSRERIGALLGQVEALTAQVAALTAQVAELAARLGTDSSNSGLPPSKDPPGARQRSLREKTGRKPGGQPGREGKTLQASDVPDRVVEHRPGVCAGCGEGLDAWSVPVRVEARQVFDLPEDLRLEVVEHRLASVACPSCREVTKAAAPAGVTRQVQYGPRVTSLAVHLDTCQYVARRRTGDLLGEVFGHKVSPATVTAMVAAAAEKITEQVRPVIVGLLTGGPVAHADETGFKVAGKTHWAHSLSSPVATWIAVHPRRGKEAVDHIAILPAFTGTLVRDAYCIYDTYQNITAHQLCCAHLLRELQAVQDHHQHPQGTWCWADQVARALTATIADPTTVTKNRHLIVSALAAAPDDPDPPGRLGNKHRALRRRLTDRLPDYLRFTGDPHVPATNNPAEQEIRTVKIKVKVSGGMRTLQGANAFTTIRSYLSTARKHHVPPLKALTSLTSPDPWVPALP